MLAPHDIFFSSCKISYACRTTVLLINYHVILANRVFIIKCMNAVAAESGFNLVHMLFIQILPAFLLGFIKMIATLLFSCNIKHEILFPKFDNVHGGFSFLHHLSVIQRNQAHVILGAMEV